MVGAPQVSGMICINPIAPFDGLGLRVARTFDGHAARIQWTAHRSDVIPATPYPNCDGLRQNAI